jgi:hypothetical protein
MAMAPSAGVAPRTGVELLALFVHAKGEERSWVAWTPKGYYLASPGAESQFTELASMRV